MDRDQTRAAIHTLLHPRSLAVVGVSGDPERLTGRPVRYLLEHGFSGPIYPVNPTRDQISGVRCYPTVDAVPGSIDIALVMVPARDFIQALEAVAAKGARAVIAFSAIPSDAEGVQAQVRAIVRRTGMRLSGPNCNGAFNLLDHIAMGFSAAMFECDEYFPGHTALIGQSGAALTSTFSQAHDAGVGFSHYVATGNEFDLSLEDFVDYMVEEESVNSIACFLEVLRRPQVFFEAAQRAWSRRKPIAVFKVGRSAHAAAIARSHTGAITGSAAHEEAFLRRAGVTVVDDLSELWGHISVLARSPLPRTPGLGILTSSGGLASALADLCDRYGVRVPELSPETRDRIQVKLKLAEVHNPLDVTGQGVDDLELWATALRSLLADERIGTVLIMLSIQGRDAAMAEIAVQAQQRFGKPVIVLWISSNLRPGTGFTVLRHSTVPVFSSGDQCIKAIAALNAYARRHGVQAAPVAEVAAAGHTAPVTPERRVLAERAAKAWLAETGIQVSQAVSAATEAEVLAAAAGVGYPVVLKVDDPRIAHKTEVGGVRVGVTDIGALTAALNQMRRDLAAHGYPDARGFLVEEMIPSGGVEWLVGVQNDFRLGPIVAFGLGGIFAEALRDVTLAPAPFDEAEALALMGQIRAKALLGNYRGIQTDTAALARLLAQVSQLAWKHRDSLAELDLNPVVSVPGRGAVVLDALAVFKPTP